VRADQPYQEPPAGWQRPVIEAVSAPGLPEAQPAQQVAGEEPELLVEVPAPPTTSEQAALQEAPVLATGAPPGVSLDSLADALIKGQKLKLSDFK
jgi:hypothetical protein